MAKDVGHTPITLDRGEAERLVHVYSGLILHPNYTYLKSTDDAQDICRTVSLKLPRKPQVFSSPGHEEAWVIRTTVSLCKNHLRSGWRRTTVALDAAEAMPAPAEEEGSLLSAVNLLPSKHRTAIYLYYYEGYVTQEITQLLGGKPATVSTQLNRGRQQLRTLLESKGVT